MLSDQQIVELVIRGKVDLFSELVARYQSPVYCLAYSLLTNQADAEDASQEVFLRAYKSLSAYTDSGRFWGWLRQITLNICLRQVHTIKPTSIDDIDDLVSVDNDEVMESVIHSEQMKEVRMLIYQLPPAYRSVLVLKYLEDMSYSEIAEALEDSVSNIQVRIHRAKKMLRERIRVSTI